MANTGDHAVTYKNLVFALGAGAVVLAGFAAWLIGRAEAAVGEHVRAPNPHPGIEERFRAVEDKLDGILWGIVDDRRRKGYEPAEPPDLRDAPDPVPPWVKAGKKR
jgi:hypothetical protein